MFLQRCFGSRALTVMAVPLLLLAVLGTAHGAINLAWDPNTEPDIAKYRVYRGTSHGGPYTQIGETTHPTVTFSDTTVVNGATYYYVATALDGLNNESINSTELPVTLAPAVPNGVAASDGAQPDRISISWQNVSGETGYKIYRSGTLNGTYTQIGTTAANTTTYDDPASCGATVSYYKVSASNSGGDSALSVADAGSTAECGTPPPPVPQNVAATDGVHSDRISISWQDVSGETGYRIYRSGTLNGTYTQIGTTAANATTYNDPASCGATASYYKVSASNSGGDSALSVADAGSTAACVPIPPPVPQNVAATDGFYFGFVKITWSSAAGADTYQVYRSDSAAAQKTAVSGWLTALEYNDTSGASGTTYYYWVKARNADGESDFSSSDTGFRAQEAETVSSPAAPAGPSSGYTALAYTYTASGGASSYSDTLQYRFDWGDGTQSAWLPAGTVTANKEWSSAGTYAVRVQARCADHTSVVSSWSPTRSVVISIDSQAPSAPLNLKLSSL